MSSRVGLNALRTGFGPRAVVCRRLGYLQIFKAGCLSSSKHKHCHLKKALPWSSTKPQIMTLV